MQPFAGQPVLILGLGRCGTSYLASFLHANGVDLGANLGQGGYLNPRGFFEDRRIVNFHRRLLAKSDRRAADVPLLASTLVHTPGDADRQEASAILHSLSRPGFWGWKDPRTVLFVDFWLSLLPEAKLIVPIRHPLENYWSYVKRVRMLQTVNPVAFFRAYARQCRRLRQVAAEHRLRTYVLDAQTAYREPELLWSELAAFLEIDLHVPPAYPDFHEREFTRLRLTGRACDVFAKAFPDAAAAFNELNDLASLRFEPARKVARSGAVY